MYDDIIVGAGISGMYAGTILRGNNRRVKLLESSSRTGGRVKIVDFCGRKVVAGAGIGRESDNILIKLNTKYDAKPVFREHSYDYIPKQSPSKVATYVQTIVEELEKKENFSDETFEHFFKRELGEENFDIFKALNEDKDFWQADVQDTLENYGFEDNVSGGHIFFPSWQKIVDGLTQDLKGCIELEHKVKKISRFSGGWKVICDKGQEYTSYNLVLAVPIPALKTILFQSTLECPELEYIKPQPFIRVYVKTNKILVSEGKKIERITIVNSVLDKIIPIDIEKCIYMISYADNEHALEVKKMGVPEIEKKVNEITDEPVKVLELAKYFWKNGTHYYAPLGEDYDDSEDLVEKIQSKFRGVTVIGEAVSINQGWVQGALESVETYLVT